MTGYILGCGFDREIAIEAERWISKYVETDAIGLDYLVSDMRTRTGDLNRALISTLLDELAIPYSKQYTLSIAEATPIA